MVKWMYGIIPVSLFDFVYQHTHGYKTASSFITHIDPDLLEKVSEKKTLNVFRYAKENIPAYHQFLAENRVGKIRSIQDFDEKLPCLEKENYVKKYPLLERLDQRHLPEHGMIVESSGSSGKHPTNWFRTLEEEKIIAKDIEFESRYLLGDKEYIVISCWTLGAWTTSYSFCYYFEPLGIVKNIGPDVEQVVRTLHMMGPEHNYLIGGYPPFIKHLLDTGKLQWKKYKIDLVVGGEGHIPGWKDYIKKKLRDDARIISAYGASDLETGMAVETPLSQYIRELCTKNRKKTQKIFGSEEIPLFFQYNPMRFYINNLPKVKEFHTTVLTKGHVGVKVKYNIKDFGGKYSYKDMINLMSKEFSEFPRVYAAKFKESSLKLPFLWIAGRSDDVISIDGVNMYPQQIEIALLGNKKTYRFIQSFQIAKVFNRHGEHRFLIYIQLQEGIKPSKHIEREIKDTIKKNLAKVSKAYRLGLHDDPVSFEPHLQLFEYQSGPFQSQRIKNKYIKR